MENILNRLREIKTQKALQDHSDSDSLYGHMSKIRDLKDFLNYPNLKKANPIKIFLKEGDALVIPKNWWHHVVSNENTYGCNFWTSETLSKTPITLKHEIDFHYEDIKDEKVFIWTSNKFYDIKSANKIKPIKFKNFIKNKKQNQYFWTLKNYNILNKNSKLVDKILNKIKIPDIIKETKQNFEFNIMACSQKHTTHLHYDDEDGLLCVTEGVKEVTLFAPEDTKNLYPIRFQKFKWKNSPAINCEYNLFRAYEKIDGLSSANLLYETCKNNIGALSSISKVIKKFHKKECENSTIWGYKKIGNLYKWEFYKYKMSKPNKGKVKFITSYEIYPKRSENGSYISDFYDEYFLEKREGEFASGSIYRVSENENKKLGIFILDECLNFKNNFDDYVSKLNYNKSSLPENILEKYKCKHLCIHQKYNNEFYIQYIGISKEDFLNFLKENEYEQSLISHYEQNNYLISNEITIVYDDNFKIKRTAFYGIV